MLKYFLPTLLIAFIISNTQACDHSSHKKKGRQEYDVKSTRLIESDELSGFACYTYKYNSPADKKQILGVLKNSNTPLPQPYLKAHQAHSKQENVAATIPVTSNVDNKQKSPQPAADSLKAIEKSYLLRQESIEPSDNSAPLKNKAPTDHAAVDNTAKVLPSSPLRTTIIEFRDLDISMSNEDENKVSNIAADMLANPDLTIVINSHGFDQGGNHADARRAALQRAINVRKNLINAGVAPNNISVNSVEDIGSKSNKLELLVQDSSLSISKPASEIQKH